MALSNSLFAVILVSLLFIGYAQSESSLSPFGKKVKSIIPKDVYDKIFTVKGKDDDQLVKALQLSFEKLENFYGAKIDKSIKEQLSDLAKRTGFNKVDATLRFFVNTNTIADTLQDKGKLNSNNIADLAQKFVNELKTTVMSLKTNNILTVFPAFTEAEGRFMKSCGLTSKGTVNRFAKHFLEESKKYLNIS